jgi:hypothetical protein
MTSILSDRDARLRALRLIEMRAEISERLSRVTVGMRTDAVDTLVTQMALVQDKYDQRRLADRS